jgi:ribosomal protein S18 acetylase RimI-like enzyme
VSDRAETKPPIRPDTVRPRADAPESDAGAPPTPDEMQAVEWERTRWVTLLGASVERDDALGVIWAAHPGRGAGLNFASRVRWPAEEVGARLAEVDAHMRAANLWPQVVVADGLSEPHDLADRLHAVGWVPLGSERLMYTRHASVVPHLDAGLRIEAVTPATALECATLEAAAFGLDPGAIDVSAGLLALAVESRATRAFIVRLAGEPIACARLVPGEPGSGVASLHAIGVAEHHRRRGYGRLITAIATRAGLATGHKLVWLSVDAGNAAAIAVYRGLAFDFTFNWTRWAAPAGHPARAGTSERLPEY